MIRSSPSITAGDGRSTRWWVKPLSQIYTFTYLRDAQGRKVFDAKSGLPIRNNVQQNFRLGPTQVLRRNHEHIHVPGYIALHVDRFQTGPQDDRRPKHQLPVRHGLSKRTLPGRDVGYVIGDGVNPNGEINKTQTAVQPFYESINPLGINEDFVFNAGFWKLRQISLGYDFGKSTG